MTIKVTATCEWCLCTKTTTLEVPTPEGWVQEDIVNVELLALKTRTGNFCSSEHVEAYQTAAPLALEAAGKDYVAKFYASMNEVRPAAGPVAKK